MYLMPVKARQDEASIQTPAAAIAPAILERLSFFCLSCRYGFISSYSGCVARITL